MVFFSIHKLSEHSWPPPGGLQSLLGMGTQDTLATSNPGATHCMWSPPTRGGDSQTTSREENTFLFSRTRIEMKQWLTVLPILFLGVHRLEPAPFDSQFYEALWALVSLERGRIERARGPHVICHPETQKRNPSYLSNSLLARVTSPVRTSAEGQSPGNHRNRGISGWWTGKGILRCRSPPLSSLH